MSTDLDSFVGVPIPSELYARIAQRYPNGVSSLVVDVVTDFLDRTGDDFAARQSIKDGIH